MEEAGDGLLQAVLTPGTPLPVRREYFRRPAQVVYVYPSTCTICSWRTHTVVPVTSTLVADKFDETPDMQMLKKITANLLTRYFQYKFLIGGFSIVK